MYCNLCNDVKDVRLRLSPPWVTYANKIKAMFQNDPEIKIEYSELPEIKLYVSNERKAVAIYLLLPTHKDIGNVTLNITVIPPNDDVESIVNNEDFDSIKELFDVAFDSNPVYAYSKEIIGVFSNPFVYVVFKNKVVQFFNDHLNDIHGLISTLYEDIARELFTNEETYFDVGCVFYNTDIEEKVYGMTTNWLS